MENSEESSPLLTDRGDGDSMAKHNETLDSPKKPVVVESEQIPRLGVEWTADGFPLSHGSVVGEPVARARWDSGLFACLGRNDEFCSSDLEVCLLGSLVPCMLYGSNVERLGHGTGAFSNHCLTYSSLYLLGMSFFGSNWLAPWFSYPSRTEIRQRFNLEGSCEAFSRSCGCCSDIIEDEQEREQCESACDFATHFFCHTCSLCQEGRELRRRLPHPGFIGRPVLVMIPPSGQRMGRGGV